MKENKKKEMEVEKEDCVLIMPLFNKRILMLQLGPHIESWH